MGFTPLLQEAHQGAEDQVQGGPQSHPSGCTLEVGWGQRHSPDAVPGHCPFQARLRMYCVWHSIKYWSTLTGQHPQCWNKTGTWSVLHQPSLQYEHRGQWSSSGRMSVEAVNALLYENSCLHWQPYMNSIQWQEICISLGQMEEEAWPDLQPNPLVLSLRKPWPLQRST